MTKLEQSKLYKDLIIAGEPYSLYTLRKYKLGFYLNFITNTPLELFSKDDYELIIINDKIIAVLINHVQEIDFRLSKTNKYFINTESMLNYISEVCNLYK